MCVCVGIVCRACFFQRSCVPVDGACLIYEHYTRCGWAIADAKHATRNTTYCAARNSQTDTDTQYRNQRNFAKHEKCRQNTFTYAVSVYVINHAVSDPLRRSETNQVLIATVLRVSPHLSISAFHPPATRRIPFVYDRALAFVTIYDNA